MNSQNQQWVALERYRAIRHDISSCISMLESSMRNLSGVNPDIPRAMRVYSAGVEKLRTVLVELDRCSEPPSEVLEKVQRE